MFDTEFRYVKVIALKAIQLKEVRLIENFIKKKNK